MDILLIILGIVCLLVGFAGCILPVLPGPPLSYVALLLLHFTEKYSFTKEYLIFWAMIAVAVVFIDNFIPMWSAKKYGGGKRAVWGSALGLFVGMFLFPPFGLIVGAFLGAVIGELSEGKATNQALKAGFGTFIGFLGGTILKMTVSGMITFYFFKTLLTQSA